MAKKENRHAELVSASANIEAPYELPEGWKWIPLLKSFENKTSSNKKLPTKDYSDAGKYAIIDQGQEFIGGYSDKTDFVFDGELPIIIFGDHTKCIKYIDFPFIQGADGVKILKPISIVDSKYFYYALQNIHFPDLGYRRHFPIFKDYQFPLPPTLAEQQRIVNRIETMFAKLDQAQEKAQVVLDSFETRKAAILHKAFTGQLTANWRKENGVLDDSWEEKTVGDCCVEVKVGIVIKPTRYYTEAEKGIPAFRSANVRENHIDDFDWVYINDEGMKNEQRSIVHTNDVLVVRSGAPGTACVVTDQFDGYNAIDILIAVPTQDIINSYFLCYYTNSPMGKNIVAEKKRGLGLTHFNVKGYSATPIKVPTLPEQQEIVRILETVLEKESRAKEAAQTVLDQIALLKKSILARAFRGEL